MLRRCALLLVLLITLTTVGESRADEIENKAIGAGVAIAAAAAAITVGIVLVVTHKPSITGCVTQGADGLTLRNEADGKTYTLHGDLDSVKAGQRVKVRGKHVKGDASSFQVIDMKKSYGACSA